MKTRYLLLLMFILIISCSRNDKRETIVEFVLFGHSGFIFLDSTKYIFDSTKLDIRQYFEFEKDSIIKIAKRKYKSKRECYTINPTMIKKIQDTLINILINNNFQKEYLCQSPCLYDGLYFTLYYKTSLQKEGLINYIPDKVPVSLKKLHDFIIGIISEASQIKNEFEFNGIVKEDAQYWFKKYPPLPPPSEIEFTAPVLIDDTKINEK